MGARSPSPIEKGAEKIHGCYTIPEDRVELPVHGMELLRSEKATRTMMGPLTSNAVTPLSSLGHRSVMDPGSAAGVEIVHSPRSLVSPLGGGDRKESIVDLALPTQQLRSQSPAPAPEMYRSASPARRAGGKSGVVEIGPGSSQAVEG